MRVIIIEQIAYHLTDDQFEELNKRENLVANRTIFSRDQILWVTKTKKSYRRLGKIELEL